MTFEELEAIKTSGVKSEEIKYLARKLLRLFEGAQEGAFVIVVRTKRSAKLLKKIGLPETNDNLIIAAALVLQEDGEASEFVTDDIGCRMTADCYGLHTVSVNSTEGEAQYRGYQEVTLGEEALADFYMRASENPFGLRVNEYLIIRDATGEIVDRRKWDGERHGVLRYKSIANDFTGKVKPVNPQQELCFDMLQDPNTPIKVITGKQGTGKDFLMVAHAMQSVIKSNHFDRIVWVRNNVEVKGSKQIGYLPGSQNEKLLPFAQIIADHVGGQEGLNILLEQGRVELCHLGFIRGRDIKDSIIYCSEAENLSREHVQLLMGRVGEGSQLWLNGDFKQVDDACFRADSGLARMISRLAGNERFGFVQLEKTERSVVAEMSTLLD